MDPQDLLYTNEFLNTNIISNKDLLENTKYYNQFTDYISNNETTQTEKYLEDDVKESSLVNIDKNLDTKWPIHNNKNHYPLFDTYINDISVNHYKKNILTRINIDSRNRDITNDFYTNVFTLTLPRTLNRISKVYINDIIFPNINDTVNNNNNSLAWQYPSKNFLGINNIDQSIIPVPAFIIKRPILYSSLPNSVFTYDTIGSDVDYSSQVDNNLVYQTNVALGNYSTTRLGFNIRINTNRTTHKIKTLDNIKIIEQPYLVNEKKINTPHLFTIEITPLTSQVKVVNRIEEITVAALQSFSPYETNFIDNDIFFKYSSMKDNYDIDNRLIYMTVPAYNDSTYQYYLNVNNVYSPNPFPLVLTTTDVFGSIGSILYILLNFTIFMDLNIYLQYGYTENELNSISYYKYIDTITIPTTDKTNNIIYLRFGLHLASGMSNGSNFDPNGSTIVPTTTENIVFSQTINRFLSSTTLVEYSYVTIKIFVGRALLFRWIFDLDNGNYVNYEFRTLNQKKRSILHLLGWPIPNVTNKIYVGQYNNGYNFVLTNYQGTYINQNNPNPVSFLNVTSNIFPVSTLSLYLIDNEYYFTNSNYIYIKLSTNTSFGQNILELISGFTLDSLQYEQYYINNAFFNVGIGEDYTYLPNCNSYTIYKKDYNNLWAKIILSPFANNVDSITSNILNNSNVYFSTANLLYNINEITIQIYDSDFKLLNTTQNFSFTLNIESDIQVLKETNIDTTTNNVNATSHYI